VVPSPPVGTFSVTLTLANPDTGSQAFARFLGAVREAPTPSPKSWTVAMDQGGCLLQLPDNPFCDPACDTTTQYCVQAPPHCVAKTPTAHSVGTVTVQGVKTSTGPTSFSAEPAGTLLAYQKADLAYPPFAEGDTIELSAAGADYPAFTITAKGISPIQVSASRIDMAPG